MSRVISYSFENPWSYQNDQGDSGEIEVPDDATDEEIDEEIREMFFERYNYGWSDVTKEGAQKP